MTQAPPFQGHFSPDGQWWWNGQQSVPVPPQPSALGHHSPPARKTNGLAIASLVLSLLWLGGLGSVLAIIFGFGSRKQIRRSHGPEAGDGLAVAGLVIGIVGVLGAVLFYGTVVTFHQLITQATTPGVVAVGQPLNVSASNDEGIRTVTVYSVSYPVAGESGQPDPPEGEEYAVADVQACASSSGSQASPTVLLFNLVFQDGQSVGVDPVSAKTPDLGSFNGIGANKCVRGFLTFEIAKGTVPTRVQYWPDPFHKYEWTLPE